MTQALSQALQRALVSHAQGRLVEAEQYCLAALKADRKNFIALNLLGVVVAQQRRHKDALRLFGRALRIKPDNAQVHCNLGNVLSALERFGDAIVSYRRAVAIEPDYADAHYHLALALKADNRHQEAEASVRRTLAIRQKTLALKPGDFLAHYFLGKEFANLDDLRDALACCRGALAINPEFANARGAMAMYQLPAVFEVSQSVADSRTAFERELSELDNWLEVKRPVDGYAAFDNVRVFYLAYQEEDNRVLLSRYGDLCARTLRRWQDARAPAGRGLARGGKIRIGIVLAYVSDTAVWNAIVRGWVEHFDRIRFDLNLFQLEPGHDAQTEFAMSRTSHIDLTEKGLPECVDSILERDLDVLIYPEIGMHPKVAVLAGLRLAPVQAASWGHPETSGLPTIDYFLSAVDLEPPGAQRNYREQLVELPQLGCCYFAPAINAVVPDLKRLGIASDRPLLICPGTPFKYAPEFDWVLVEMARRLRICHLVFFIHEQSCLSEKLRLRLKAAFARRGLAFDDYAVFIPWLSVPQFHGLLARADMLLDTIGFSGLNTVMQSVACGLPVVTREGRFLRGRLASGILKRMGLSELVAATEDEYIALAIKLAGDPAFRQLIRRRIEESRHVLFDNVAPIRALEQFCADVVKRS